MVKPTLEVLVKTALFGEQSLRKHLQSTMATMSTSLADGWNMLSWLSMDHLGLISKHQKWKMQNSGLDYLITMNRMILSLPAQSAVDKITLTRLNKVLPVVMLTPFLLKLSSPTEPDF